MWTQNENGRWKRRREVTEVQSRKYGVERQVKGGSKYRVERQVKGD